MRSQNSCTRLKIVGFFFVSLIALTVRQADAAQTLFVGNDTTPGAINAYSLPISAASTPAFAIAANNILAVGLNSAGSLVAGDLGGKLYYFPAPLSAASTPTATFNGASVSPGQIAFTSSGDFWTGSNAIGQVDRFTPPFTNASVPAQTITLPGAFQASGVAFDASMNLYLSDRDRIYVYAPPYAGAPTITATMAGFAYRKMAVSGTQLFVGQVSGASGAVEVYNLPLTPASTPAFQITGGVNIPETVAFDASGNLYVGNLVGGTVSVYGAPFSAASAPVTTLTIPAFAIFGMTIGSAAAAPVATSAPAIDPGKLLALGILLLAVGLLTLRVRQ